MNRLVLQFRRISQTSRLFFIVMLLATVSSVAFGHVTYAAETTVYPANDISKEWHETSSGTNHWSLINKTGNGNENVWICSTAAATDVFGVAPTNIQQGVERIRVQARVGTQYELLGTNPYVAAYPSIGGSPVTSTTGEEVPGPTLTVGPTAGCSGGSILFPLRAYQYKTLGAKDTGTRAPGSEWTQAEFDTMRLHLVRTGDYNRYTRTLSLWSTVDYVPYSTLTQAKYKFFQNANSTTPGAQLAAENTPIAVNTASSTGDVRLRMNIQTTGERWLQKYGTYKLQYAERTGTCGPSLSWNDVGTSGAVKWKDNATPSSGQTAGAHGGDPVVGTNVRETYQESNPFTKIAQVTANNSGLWDFSLSVADAPMGSSYCLRVVNNDGSTQPLNNYNQYPQVTIIGELGIQFVNEAQAAITNPSVPFTPMYTMTNQCQVSQSQNPAGGQYMRVTNNTTSGQWSVSIAPTEGASAAWKNSANVKRYDYNDGAGSPAGCANGDADSLAGRLTVNASTSTVYRQSCAPTGISAGTNASFSNTITDITLAQSSSGTPTFCWWDLRTPTASQTIPAATPEGDYYIDMTVTVTTP